MMAISGDSPYDNPALEAEMDGISDGIFRKQDRAKRRAIADYERAVVSRTAHWTTRDGTKIRVMDMSDTHLRNTIKMLERNHEAIGLSGVMAMGAYSDNAPDGASYAIDREIDELAEMDAADRYPILGVMREEAERRDLALD